MKYIKQFVIIIAISFIGELLNKLIPLPIPASIYGLVIMFTALKTKIIPLSSIKETGNFFYSIETKGKINASDLSQELKNYLGFRQLKAIEIEQTN